MTDKSGSAHIPRPSGTGKNPGGRPRKPDAERRSVVVEVYLSPEEKDAVDWKARKARMGVSAFMRKASLGVRMEAPPPIENAEISKDLRDVGNILNQLAKRAHAGKAVTVDSAYLDWIRDLCEQVSAAVLFHVEDPDDDS